MIVFQTRIPLDESSGYKEQFFQWLQDYLCETGFSCNIEFQEHVYEQQSDDGKKILRCVQKQDNPESSLIQAAEFVEQSDQLRVHYQFVIQDGYLHYVVLHYYNEMASEDKDVSSDFLQQMLWMGVAGKDQAFYVDDQPMVLRRDFGDDVLSVLKRSKLCLLPVLYIPMHEGSYICDYQKLAKMLFGVAHVVVPGNPYVDRLIKTELADGQNPVHLEDRHFYMITSDGASYSAKFEQDMGVPEIYFRDLILQFMCRISIGSDFLFQRIWYENTVSETRDEELMQVYEDVISDKDRKIAELEESVANMFQEVKKLNGKIAALENRSNSGASVSLTTNEKDLYPGEVKDMVLKILDKDFASMSPDMVSFRRYHILKDILENNERTHEDEQIIETYKNALAEGSLTKDVMRTIRGIGFDTVEDDSGKHFKVRYADDERYQTSVARSPSDYRSGKNGAAYFMKVLFGC